MLSAFRPPSRALLFMCILFIARNLHPDYPLVVAANRDEFFDRESLPMHHWQDAPVLAGRDALAGGTWLGINTQTGLFAAVTNIRSSTLPPTGKTSRGTLVRDTLMTSDQNLEQFCQQTAQQIDSYNPFNLLCGTCERLFALGSVDRQPTVLPDGLTSISNGPQADQWPKMDRGTRSIGAYLGTGNPIDVDRLFQLLADDEKACKSVLQKTGMPEELEETLSSVFIKPVELNGRRYGTRCSSVLLCNPEGTTLIEQTWLENGTAGQRLEFFVPKMKI